jgi:PKD repeat protein
LALAVAVLALLLPATARADVNVGFEGPSYSGAGAAPTASKPESKLWWNDGSWWANMYDAAAKSYAIFRLDTGNTWVSTGVKTDLRATTHADTLWDGNRLYIASHVFSNTPASGNPARLYRFSYNAAADTYTLDSGFPAQISNVKSETLVIAKDSTGKLWATWVAGSKVYVNRTVGGDQNWGTPFVVPGAGTTVTSDDISSIIAFGGDKVGILWSNQADSSFYFAVHRDGEPDTSWTIETALHATGIADDHINLKADTAGRVYAAVKTSQTASNSPGVLLLVRSATGAWQAPTVWRVGDGFTKPLVLLDEAKGIVHVLGTSPCCTGGVVYEKTSPVGAISFAEGLGTVVLNDASTRRLTDPTSTKQNVPASSGFALLASNDGTSRYWFNTLAVSAPVADFSATPTSGSSPLTVNFSDLSTNGPTTWSWDFGDGGTSTAQNPTHVYAAAGTYTVALTATNASGSDTATKVNYITVSETPPPAPVADFSATPTSGSPPLTVNFSDLSTNGPTTWSWDFGDGGTSTAQNPTHVYAAAGTYTVALTATNASGSDTETKVNYITATDTPTFRAASSAANPTATTLTIPAPSGVVNGDVLVASVDVRGNPTITAPTGWTLIRLDLIQNSFRKATYYRVATNSEPANYTWSFSSSLAASGGILAFSGVSTSNPIDAHGGLTSTGTNLITAPSVTTTVPNTMLVGLFAATGSITVTPPSGMAERFDVTSNLGTFKISSEGANALQGTAGATGDRVARADIGTNPNIGQLVALRPAT